MTDEPPPDAPSDAAALEPPAVMGPVALGDQKRRSGSASSRRLTRVKRLGCLLSSMIVPNCVTGASDARARLSPPPPTMMLLLLLLLFAPPKAEDDVPNPPPASLSGGGNGEGGAEARSVVVGRLSELGLAPPPLPRKSASTRYHPSCDRSRVGEEEEEPPPPPLGPSAHASSAAVSP